MSGTVTQQYARISQGLIAEYPMTIIPGFTLADCYSPSIVAVCAPIPLGVYPAVGWLAIETSGVWSFTAPQAPDPSPESTMAQQASTRLAGGLNITSQSASGLNGLYATDPVAQSNITAIQVYIQSNGKFPGTSGSQIWLDADNSPHTFTTTGQFTEFATAIADYVADLTLVAMTNSGTLPPTTTTIA